MLLDRRLPFRVAPRWRRRVVLGVFGVGGRRRGDGCAQQEGQEHADEQRWQGGRSRHRVEGKGPSLRFEWMDVAITFIPDMDARSWTTLYLLRACENLPHLRGRVGLRGSPVA